MLNELYCDNRVVVFEYNDSGTELMCVFNKESHRLHACSKKDFFYRLLTWEISLTCNNKLDITEFFNYFSDIKCE